MNAISGAYFTSSTGCFAVSASTSSTGRPGVVVVVVVVVLAVDRPPPLAAREAASMSLKLVGGGVRTPDDAPFFPAGVGLAPVKGVAVPGPGPGLGPGVALEMNGVRGVVAGVATLAWALAL